MLVAFIVSQASSSASAGPTHLQDVFLLALRLFRRDSMCWIYVNIQGLGKGLLQKEEIVGNRTDPAEGLQLSKRKRERREREIHKKRERELVVQVLLEAAQRQRDLEQAALLRRLWRFIQMQLKRLSLG